jgi:hypothetical protein
MKGDDLRESSQPGVPASGGEDASGAGIDRVLRSILDAMSEAV